MVGGGRARGASRENGPDPIRVVCAHAFRRWRSRAWRRVGKTSQIRSVFVASRAAAAVAIRPVGNVRGAAGGAPNMAVQPTCRNRRDFHRPGHATVGAIQQSRASPPAGQLTAVPFGVPSTPPQLYSTSPCSCATVRPRRSSRNVAHE
jgi:hypothetical protein